MSDAFEKIQNTLDNIMKERTLEGILEHPAHEPTTKDHEILWKKEILGNDIPDKLRWFFNCN